MSNVGKSYSMERSALKRLWRVLRGRPAQGPCFHALSGIDLKVNAGETIGIIGPNGAGKSTLLQIVSGVLQPSSGQCHVDGRVTALLELGAGFSMEMTGRENLRLNGPLLGLSVQETETLLPEIIAFAGIGEHIDQPVKTYSSGMFVRLAFSLITAARPDILIIDEALSVGDAAFATKSFDRILELKRSGTTILFCSHALYQIQALCDRAIWLLNGKIQSDGLPRDVINDYQSYLDSQAKVAAAQQTGSGTQSTGATRLGQITVAMPDDGVWRTAQTDLILKVEFHSDAGAPSPHVAALIYAADGRLVASVGTHNDGLVPQRDTQGRAAVELVFTALPLLQGTYQIDIVLLCNRGVLFLDTAAAVARIQVVQQGLEMGIVTLPRQWRGVTHA